MNNHAIGKERTQKARGLFSTGLIVLLSLLISSCETSQKTQSRSSEWISKSEIAEKDRLALNRIDQLVSSIREKPSACVGLYFSENLIIKGMIWRNESSGVEIGDKLLTVNGTPVAYKPGDVYADFELTSGPRTPVEGEFIRNGKKLRIPFHCIQTFPIADELIRLRKAIVQSNYTRCAEISGALFLALRESFLLGIKYNCMSRPLGENSSAGEFLSALTVYAEMLDEMLIESAFNGNMQQVVNDAEAFARNPGLEPHLAQQIRTSIRKAQTLQEKVKTQNAEAVRGDHVEISSGGQRSPIDIYKDSSESVAMIVNMGSDGKVQSLGSGFFAFDGFHIITNFHVISNASNIFVKLGDKEPFEIREVYAFDKAQDLAILTADTAGKPLELSNRVPQVGEKLFAIGNPHGLENTLSEGILSGVREIEGTSLYQISAPISPGSSGGPVIGSDGAVFGVSTSSIEGQNLNFAVPASYIEELWERPTRISVGDSRLKSIQSVARIPERKAENSAQLEVVGLRISYKELGSQVLSGSVVNRSASSASNIMLRAKWWSKEDPNTILNSEEQRLLLFKPLEPGLGQTFTITCGSGFGGCDSNWKYSVEIVGYDLM